MIHHTLYIHNSAKMQRSREENKSENQRRRRRGAARELFLERQGKRGWLPFPQTKQAARTVTLVVVEQDRTNFQRKTLRLFTC